MVLVGAGSAVFTKGLVMDILERPDEKWHIALVDINEEVLEIIKNLCVKMINKKNADVEISASPDIKDVLSGADFVVSTIGVGGRRAWEQDVFIPRKYGVYQPVGDTIGPGGISRAMRMIPQLLDIAKAVQSLCPKAMFITYSNPMTMSCMAIRRETGIPVLGLCHGVKNGVRRVAKFMGVSDVSGKGLSYTACGLNHMVFMYHLRYEGRDFFPDFIQKLNETPVEGRKVGPLTADFVRKYSTYVVSDDRHFSEFVPSTMAKGAYYGKTLGTDRFSFEETIREGDTEFDEYAALAGTGVELPEGFFERDEGEHEQLMDIIEAMTMDKPGVFYVNLPNQGAVTGLPDDVVIERPAFFDGSGIAPLQMTDFPTELLPYMARYSAVYEMAVEAALKGNTRLMRLAVEECSPVLEKDQAIKMVDELLFAQKEYLS